MHLPKMLIGLDDHEAQLDIHNKYCLGRSVGTRQCEVDGIDFCPLFVCEQCDK